MVYSRVSEKVYLIRLVRGENVGESILNFCKKLEIANAALSGIGAVENPVIAYYNVKDKKFIEKSLKGDYEMISFLGNIAVFNNSPLLHAHVTLSDKNMRVFGGHFIKATIAASMEIVLQIFDTNYDKVYNDEVGLNLWNLPESL